MSEALHREPTSTGVDPAKIDLPPTYSIDLTSLIERHFEKSQTGKAADVP